VKPAETRRHRVTELPGAAAESGAADVESGAVDVESGAADVECGAADVECGAADVEGEHRLIEKCVTSLSTTTSPR